MNTQKNAEIQFWVHMLDEAMDDKCERAVDENSPAPAGRFLSFRQLAEKLRRIHEQDSPLRIQLEGNFFIHGDQDTDDDFRVTEPYHWAYVTDVSNLRGAPVLKLADGYRKDPPANAMTVRQTYEVCLQIGPAPVRLDCLLDQRTADDFGILAVEADISGAPAEIVIKVEDTMVEDMQFFENWYWDMWDNDSVEIVLGGYDPED